MIAYTLALVKNQFRKRSCTLEVSMNEFMSSIPSKKFSLAYTGQVRREEGPLNTGVLLVKLG